MIHKGICCKLFKTISGRQHISIYFTCWISWFMMAIWCNRHGIFCCYLGVNKVTLQCLLQCNWGVINTCYHDCVELGSGWKACQFFRHSGTCTSVHRDTVKKMAWLRFIAIILGYSAISSLSHTSLRYISWGCKTISYAVNYIIIYETRIKIRFHVFINIRRFDERIVISCLSMPKLRTLKSINVVCRMSQIRSWSIAFGVPCNAYILTKVHSGRLFCWSTFHYV